MKSFLLVCLSLLTSSLTAQIIVNGVITEFGSGEALAYVRVSDVSSQSGTLSNTDGYFSISLPSGEQVLAFSLSGYQPMRLALNLRQDTSLSIAFQTYETRVDTVEIFAKPAYTGEIGLSRNIISIQQMKQMPMLAGEADALKAMQLLPGVQFGREGTSGLFVRGGSPDQNLILLDDIPIYNVSHLFGFASLFPPASLKSADIYKGGFPAEHGGRLSSVIQLQSKEGDLEKRKTSIRLGTISGQITTEGPIAKGKASYFVSARRTWLDLLARPLIKTVFKQEGVNGSLGYGFYDVVAKVNYKIGPKDRIYLSVYTGEDKVRNELGILAEEDADPSIQVNRSNSLKWGNIASSLRYQKLLGTKWFMKSIVGYSQYAFQTTRFLETIDNQEIPPESSSSHLSFSSSIQDLHLKQIFDFHARDKHRLRFGLTGSKKSFQPDVQLTETVNQGEKKDSLFNDQLARGTLLAAFVEDHWRPNLRWRVRAGLRLESFHIEGLSKQSLQPRMAVSYALADASTVSISYSFVQQYLHLLSNTGLGLPADLWVPATKRIPPSASHQAVIGWEGKGPFQSELSVEAYYKSFADVIEYKDGTSLLSSFDSWENKVESGKGTAYGLELWLRRHIGRLTGWLSYTLSWNKRLFPTINRGQAFSFRYDRRHDLSLFLNYPLKKKHKSLSMTWMYLSGSRQTVPVGIANVPYDLLTDLNGGTENILTLQGITGFGSVTPYSTSRNNYQLRAFHKLDIAYHVKKKKKNHTRDWSYGMYNVYGRRNPYYIFYQSTLERDENLGESVLVNRLAEQSLLFWIPYVSVEIGF